jgi:AAA ATPase domain/Protein of unknown function (DUF3696)
MVAQVRTRSWGRQAPMLTRVQLENFKGFGKLTSIPLAPLTLIYGQNSAGKSSIIQALLLLKQSMGDDRTQQLFAQPRLVTQGELTDLGTFVGILHDHRTRNALRIGFDCTSDVNSVTGRALRLDARPISSVHVEFGFKYDRSEARSARQTDAELGFNGTQPLHFRVTGGSSASRLAADARLMSLEARSVRHASDMVAGMLDHIARRPGSKPLTRMPKRESLVSALRSKAFREQWQDQRVPWTVSGFFPTRLAPTASARESRSNAAAVVNEALELSVETCARAAVSALQRIRYIGPLRAAPSRVHEVTEDPGGSIGTSGEYAPVLLAQDPVLRAEVNEWLVRFGISYKVETEDVATKRGAPVLGQLTALLLQHEQTKTFVSPRDVGFGISQVLPVIVQLVVKAGLTVCIEQPEIHLHPRLQAELGDLLLETTAPREPGRKARPPTQVIAETHSEHLVLRLQRRVREGKADPERIAILYVDRDDAGRTAVYRLRLSSDGEFRDPWPRGFFDERLDEVFAGV